MYDIGIVIVNYNVRHFLVQCLQSVRKSALNGLSIKTWVVDNASVDGAVTLLKREFPEVELIENHNNVGFSKANNQAIPLIDARYVLLLNPDTILEEDTLYKCFQYMEKHQEAGALGVRMIDGNGQFLPESKRKIPDLWNSFCKLTYLSKLFPSSPVFSGYNLGYLDENQIAEIEVLCGAFMFLRKKTLDKTGLLDERFFMYGEDIDLSFRIGQAGYKVIYFPETSIIHFKGESTKKASLQYVKTFYGAMSLYVNKHYTGKRSLIFRWFILIAIQIRAFLSLVSKFLLVLSKIILDVFVIWGSLHFIKSQWASYYFGDPDYYQGTFIHVNIVIYTLIWIFSLWFFGRYDKKYNRLLLFYGVLSGLLGILMVYALEPEAYRTSRALIIIGSFATFIYIMVSELLFYFLQKKENKSETTMIVALKEDAEKLKELLTRSRTNEGDIYVINPGSDTSDPYYSNHISNLEKTVRYLKADHLIFSSKSLPIKDIMEYMTTLHHDIEFKIAGDESLGIIGRKVPGEELYSLEIRFPLMDSLWKRTKWLTDIFLCFVFIVFFPLIFILNVFSKQAIKNIFLVLIQKKTWVGYGGDPSDYKFLPELPKAVISYPLSKKYFMYQEGHFKNENVEYAKQYSHFSDIAIVFSNINNLHGK
ncbi:MAG: glycosyltransferase [Saprospiraceae bacterium]|nr:glycosyltransferase [Saprospiraceae bacterium]